MKPLCLVSAPPDTYSGYGARSRDFIKALVAAKGEEWDIQILSQRWGNCPGGFLADNKEEWGWMIDLLFVGQQQPPQPDYWFHFTVPNEFQPVGKTFSCGVTAGIETTICDPSWVEGINRMNLTLVSSEHAKKVFQDSVFEMRDKAGNPTGQVKLQKPIEVLFEGVDLNKYFYQESSPSTELVNSLNSIKESFCYLFVGHWMQGEINHDRKNVGYLIKSFLEAYKGKKSKPALILKAVQVGGSIMDREEILRKIDIIRKSVKGDLPNIYLLHGELEDSDMNDLYNHSKVKAMVSFTKGEGFGRPLLEFTQSKKLIIASGWSGQMDFLDPQFSYLLSGDLHPLHQSSVVQNMLIPESSWFQPNDAQINKMWKEVYENYDKYEVPGKRQAHKAKTEFSYDAMKDKLASIIEEKFIKAVPLKLPTLKKIELPKLQKVSDAK
jgi:hypothetical protein